MTDCLHLLHDYRVFGLFRLPEFIVSWIILDLGIKIYTGNYGSEDSDSNYREAYDRSKPTLAEIAMFVFAVSHLLLVVHVVSVIYWVSLLWPQ